MNADVHSIHGICRRLLETGAMARSQCGAAFIRALKPLFDSGVVRWKQAGAGQRLTVLDEAAYQRWFLGHFPEAEIPDDIQLSHIQGVARFRNSKALRSNLPLILCVRSIRDGVLTYNALPIATTRATQEHGVFAFTLANPGAYSLNGDCVLIEKLAVFHLFERLKLEAPLAIWTGGISSNRFLTWLASNIQHGARILHLPDYDPVGLSEFLRYYKRLAGAVALYVPDHLPALFKKHSKRSLLADPKNQRMLMQLRNATHPAVRQIVAMIDEYNGGLEHEAIFVMRTA